MGPFWSSSILVVFHFGRLPFWSSSILVVFHFGSLPFWSSSISVVFIFWVRSSSFFGLGRLNFLGLSSLFFWVRLSLFFGFGRLCFFGLGLVETRFNFNWVTAQL